MVMLVLSDSDEGMEAVEDVLSVDRQEGWRSSPPKHVSDSSENDRAPLESRHC